MHKNRVWPVSLIFLIKDNMLCLGRRKNTGDMDGLLSVPGGHVESNESPLNAIVRESKEEAGIDLSLKNTYLFFTLYRKNQYVKHETVDFFFVCTKWNGEIQNNELNKCEGFDFYNINELPKDMILSQRQAFDLWSQGYNYGDFGLSPQSPRVIVPRKNAHYCIERGIFKIRI